MASFASIEALEPEWLWRNRILAGELTLCAGGSGIGKSFLAADLAARITTGRPMPDGTASPAGSAILASVEDDATTATVWRLRAAGADLAKVHDAGDDLVLPGSIPALRQMVSEIGDVRLSSSIRCRPLPAWPCPATSPCGGTSSSPSRRSPRTLEWPCC